MFQVFKGAFGNFSVLQDVSGILDVNSQTQPIFLFIDPFGYKDIPMCYLRQLIAKYPKIELLINFMVGK